MELNKIFSSVIANVKKVASLSCTIIYSQTRKQCAILWRMFNIILGQDFYLNGTEKPDKCLVQMFHAGTQDSAKKHILDDIAQTGGVIQVLVCTVAFGMGINCKEVHQIIHFCPSVNMES